MHLSITRIEKDEEWHGGGGITGAGGHSKAHDAPLKLLVPDAGGRLMPCNYRTWFWGGGHGCGSGNEYIPTGDDPVPADQIEDVEEVSCRSESATDRCPNFIQHLMDAPRTGIQCIRFLGTELREEPVAPRRVFFLTLKRPPRQWYEHQFVLCRFREPYALAFVARRVALACAATERAEQQARLATNRSPLDVSTYLASIGETIHAYDCFPIEVTEERHVASGANLPPLQDIRAKAEESFIGAAPPRTYAIAAVREEIEEHPSTFFVRGKQRVTLRGVALVLKERASSAA